MDLYEFMRGILREQRWGKVLSSPLTYQLVEKALWLARKGFRWRATYLMARFALAQTKKAYTGEAPVVWTSAFFPVEIVWGLGLCPFSPEVAAAFITSLGFADQALSQADQKGYSRDLCSFHRCIAGAAADGYLPPPAALVASTHLCDGAPLLFQNLAEHYKVPYLVLDVPYESTPEAEKYVAHQLAQIWNTLAEITDRRPDIGSLARAVDYSNQFRNHLEAVNTLRCRIPAPIQGSEMLNYLYLFFAGQGHKEAAAVFACLERELESAVDSENRERFRLLWLHLKPYHKGELMHFLEKEAGCSIAFEEMSHVYWPPLDPVDPFPSLARKVLSHFAYKPLEWRIAVVDALARKYQVDGIVHFSHWGCRQSCGGSLILRDALQEKGWPVLLLDGDCLDQRNEAPGAVLTRAQAFLEVLEGRKEGSGGIAEK